MVSNRQGFTNPQYREVRKCRRYHFLLHLPELIKVLWNRFETPFYHPQLEQKILRILLWLVPFCQ